MVYQQTGKTEKRGWSIFRSEDSTKFVHKSGFHVIFCCLSRHEPLMTNATKHDRIFVLHKQDLSWCSIIAKGGHIMKVTIDLKYPKGSGTKSSVKDSKMIYLHRAGGPDKLSLKTIGSFFTWIMILTHSACSPTTVRWYLKGNGKQKNILTSPLTPQSCWFGLCKGEPNIEQGKVEKILVSDQEKNVWSLLMIPNISDMMIFHWRGFLCNSVEEAP